jgi:hypothetical protein
MTNLLRAGIKFEFDERERESFTQLKEIFCDSPSLYEVGAETEHGDRAYGCVNAWVRRDTYAEKQRRQRDASSLLLLQWKDHSRGREIHELRARSINYCEDP